MSETITPDTPNSINPQGQLNVNLPKSTRGFASHPENINRTGGPKKEWTMKSLLLEVAEEEIVLKNKLGQVTGRKLFKELIARKLWQKAASGDMQAIKEILDRIDGKATQHVDHTSGGEKLTTPMHMLPEEKDE